MIRRILDNILWNISGRTKRAELMRKKGAKIGERCEIYRDVNFGSEPYLIKIGDHVRITSGVKFCTHDGGLWVLRENYADMKDSDYFGSIEIGNNVHIGWNSIIMPSVKIGNNCIIGCGAIVTRDIPDNSVAAGVPAKVIKTVEQYYEDKKDEVLHIAGMDAKSKKQFILNQKN